jgi:hypothetical protein
VADALGPELTASKYFGSASIYEINPPSTAWLVLDGIKADCGTLANLMKAAMEMAGVTWILKINEHEQKNNYSNVIGCLSMLLFFQCCTGTERKRG